MSLERTAIPREFSNPRRFTRRYRTIVALVVFAAISGPIGCVAAFANKPADEVEAAEPRHAAYAAAVAESYLDGRPLPVPVADGLSPSAGREPIEVAGEAPPADPPEPAPIAHRWAVPMDAAVLSVPAGGDALRPVEAHRFLVGVEGGAFVLTVSLVETTGGAPALGSEPAIEPFVPDTDAAGAPALDWAAVMDTTRPSTALRERVAEWAAAYAADDRRRLLEITGDPRTGVEYVGLGTWTVIGEPVVGGVFDRGDGTAACHVEVALAAVGDGEVTARASYDLVVESATDPLPSIVAWGPSGTALTLEVHGNASPLPEEQPGVATTTTTTSATEEGGA